LPKSVEKRLRIAVDTGGTFTDFVVLDESTRDFFVFKVPSTRGHEADGILSGVAAALGKADASGANLAFFVHGTTVGTNAILEENGARTGLLVTAGYRGIYEIGEQSRPYGATTYDLQYERPRPLVTPDLTQEIPERVTFDGAVLTDLDEEAAVIAIRQLLDAGVQSIAICLLFAFRNPTHERVLRRLLAELAPQVNVSLSSDVAPQIREYYRLSTTLVNAYLNPRLVDYLAILESGLRALGSQAPQHYIMRSNGGIATFPAAAERSVQTILSGPAAGVVAAARVVAETPEFRNLVTFDMGGTSTDVALIHDGEPVRRMSGKVHGRDVLVPMLDIHTVAAGGGTLAWIDDFGILQVGPHSAGANPGPACYGKGGTRPTVTDANVVLGFLSADNGLAGGSLRLDYVAAERAIREHIALPLGIDVMSAASGMLEIVNVKMQEAIKVVSSNRGYDLRDFHLLAFGGAGPLHASALATELGMKGVLVPAFPGAFSALGLLLSDVRTDYVSSEIVDIARADSERVHGAFASMKEIAVRELVEQGFLESEIRYEVAFDLRYVGQGYELTVAAPDLVAGGELLDVRRRFDDMHEQLTGHAAPDEAVELVNVRLTAVVAVPQAPISSPFAAARTGDGGVVGRRQIYSGGAWSEAVLYDRRLLADGQNVDGPAILLQDDATTVIGVGQSGTVRKLGQIEIRMRSQRPLEHALQ
jgi:N-methylhydantoinase A